MRDSIRLVAILFVVASCLCADLPAEPEQPAFPDWYNQGGATMQTSPANVALAYLRLMEEWWPEAAYTLLTTDSAIRMGDDDAKAFAEDVGGKKDWHTYADEVCTVKPVSENEQRVYIRAFVENEGYFTIDRIEFVLRRVGERWLVDEMNWGESKKADDALPERKVRSDMDTEGKRELRGVGRCFLRLVPEPGSTERGPAEHGAVPPWLDPFDGDMSDTKPAGAVNGFVRAVADSHYAWARYYRAGMKPIPAGDATLIDSTMRLYFPSWDEAEVDQIDDSNSVVWTSFGFSVGRELKVQSVAFTCVKRGTVWKIEGMTEGPEITVSVEKNDVPCASSRTTENKETR